MSEDGAEWSETCYESFWNMQDLAYGAERFVLAGHGGDLFATGGDIFVSLDGIDWTQAAGEVPRARAVAYGGGKFIAVGTAAVATSPDGSVWTKTPFDYHRQLFDVVHGDGTFVITGNFGSVFASSDGVTWTEEQSGLAGAFFLRGVVHGNGLFVAVGDEYDLDLLMSRSAIITSPNGTDWSIRHNGTNQGLRGCVTMA